MGVQFEVESAKNPAFYAENDPNRYLKYAWRDIRWEQLFDTIGIDMSAYIYYDDPAYNYRSPEDVEYMRDAIRVFVEEETNELRDDAAKLLEFFNYYVENGAHFTIF